MMESSALIEFTEYLKNEERSRNTIEKYLRDLKAFFMWLSDRELCKETVLSWKAHLSASYAPTSTNSMLAALNRFLEFSGKPEYKVKPLKIQREIFARPEKELTRQEYTRLVKAAQEKQNERLALLLQTICGTGIRVSELQFITLEAVQTGRAIVDCKGKNRTVFLPKELCRSLKRYCRQQGIDGGMVFRSKRGGPLNRSNIWRSMKGLCKRAGVEQSKVFPHNLRHLFARTYYSIEKDLSRLADLLGHTNISTTRIYTMESGRKHIKQLERMGLVFGGK